MEKLSSQVLITDQSLQSQLTTKLLYTDTLKVSSNQHVESNVQETYFYQVQCNFSEGSLNSQDIHVS